jgi:hypothetical protein
VFLTGVAIGAILGMAFVVAVMSRAATGIVRRQWHRFFNDLQVIGGWLELSRDDQALRHVDVVRGRVQAMDWLKTLPPWCQLWAWTLEHRAERWGVDLAWGIDGGGLSRSLAVRLLRAVGDALNWAHRADLPALTIHADSQGFDIRLRGITGRRLPGGWAGRWLRLDGPHAEGDSWCWRAGSGPPLPSSPVPSDRVNGPGIG